MLDDLSNHYKGELPDYIPVSQYFKRAILNAVKPRLTL